MNQITVLQLDDLPEPLTWGTRAAENHPEVRFVTQQIQNLRQGTDSINREKPYAVLTDNKVGDKSIAVQIGAYALRTGARIVAVLSSAPLKPEEKDNLNLVLREFEGAEAPPEWSSLLKAGDETTIMKIEAWLKRVVEKATTDGKLTPEPKLPGDAD